MMNMSRFLCVGVSAAALLYCGDVWASEIYGTSVPEGYQAYNLNESGLNAGMMLSLPQKGAKQVASVCFITDAGNCGGAGGGIDSSSSSSGPGPIDPDGSNMCKLEGYVNTVCTNGQQKGTLCPYDSRWHTGCKCADEYNKTCTGTDEQGKGTACGGKYKECCKKCTGYNYTSSNIPTGHIKTASCSSCTGTKYKTKCDTNSSNTGTYVNCGSATGSGSSCKDDTGTYYTKCTCPTMYEWSASAKKCVCSTGYKYTCSGTGYAGGEGNSCDNKYQKCKCASGYTWNASTGTCTCGSTYKYTCSGSNITGGSGTACGGKYTACKCATGFTWNSSSGMCVCNGTDWCSLNQDCSSLGYKKQTCPERTIKCPFDTSYVYCISCQSEYKYKYTCSGTGYAGGSGSACGGKYTQCTCASGYKWDATSGVCKADRAVCEVGTLYYSDNTCSNNLESGKTLLGVVIYSNSPSAGGWIMTVEPVVTGIEWSGSGTDIPGLTNYTSTPTDIQASCTNTDIITAYGSSSDYPTAWTAKSYKPAGTPNGKNWCLPSGGLLNTINNSTNFAKVNAGITTAGGTKIGFGTSVSSECIWSSSEYSSDYTWFFYADMDGSSIGMGNIVYKDGYDGSMSLRPVMEF